MDEKYSKHNIFLKIQEARILLKEKDIKKSGKSAMSKEKGYFTLEDIQAPITEVCAVVGLCPVFTFSEKDAVLTIYDCGMGEQSTPIAFTSPMTEIKINNMPTIQSLGGIETYHRRYLYCIAFDIVDSREQDSGDELNYHDIFKIKRRIEEKLTLLMKNGNDKTEIAKLVGMSEKNLEAYLNMPGQINTLERVIDAKLSAK